MMSDILVIIITYNAIKWAEKCFSSLYNSTVPLDIYVIDNGSTDGTQEYIINQYPNILFHQSPTNLGFGRANNIGIKYAIENNYEYIYLLNQDAWVLPDTLEKLINTQKRHPEYGILSPFQAQSNMKSLDINFVSWVCSYNYNNQLFNDLYWENTQDIYSVPMVMAAHWLISRKCFLKVGGFSPTFTHYGEDNNYANRTSYHGFKIGIVPSAVAVHDRENRKEGIDKKIYMSYIQVLIYISNINECKPNLFIRTIKSTIKSTISYKSFKPIKLWSSIIKHWFIYKKNTLESKAEGAFLNL